MEVKTELLQCMVMTVPISYVGRAGQLMKWCLPNCGKEPAVDHSQ